MQNMFVEIYVPVQAEDRQLAENVMWSNSKLALRAQTIDLLHITNLSPPPLYIGRLQRA